mgnify:CR=1 FL=1
MAFVADEKDVLALFDLAIPLLPRTVLRPMNEEAGKARFKRLRDLRDRMDREKADLDRIVKGVNGFLVDA